MSNPEMKRSVMAWIARDATNVTCSEKTISLEFFASFLFQDKKLGGLGCNPKYKCKNTHCFQTLTRFTDKTAL
jgi:hypothetical protein